MFKKKIFKINNIIYPIIFPIVNLLAHFFSKITEKLYGLVMMIEWARDPSPEWMDHDQDYYFQTRSKGKTFFFETDITSNGKSLFLIKLFLNVSFKYPLLSLNILDLIIFIPLIFVFRSFIVILIYFCFCNYIYV